MKSVAKKNWTTPNLTTLLTQTDRIMAGGNGWHADPNLILPSGVYRGRVHVGVDLGTAYTVLMVLDENYQPIAGEYQFAQVTRDGLVVDFIGAVDLLREMKSKVEKKLGFTLTSAATAYPPGVPEASTRPANLLTMNVSDSLGKRGTTRTSLIGPLPRGAVARRRRRSDRPD